MTTSQALKRTGRGRVVTILAAALVILAGTTTTAGAATGTARPSEFAAQARAAHLTGKDVAALDREAARIQAKLGGTRAALNVIDLNGKGTVRLVVPGEAYPRDLTTAATSKHIITAKDAMAGKTAANPSVAGRAAAARPNPCLFYADYGHLCTYSAEYFQGTVIDMYRCQRYAIPWWSPGSWDNNQTTGTRPIFYNVNGVGYPMDGARSFTYSYSWAWVYYIDNC